MWPDLTAWRRFLIEEITELAERTGQEVPGKEFCDPLKAGKDTTDEELGQFFGVCERTINNWKTAHPQFLQSIKRGKVIADALNFGPP